MEEEKKSAGLGNKESKDPAVRVKQYRTGQWERYYFNELNYKQCKYCKNMTDVKSVYYANDGCNYRTAMCPYLYTCLDKEFYCPHFSPLEGFLRSARQPEEGVFEERYLELIRKMIKEEKENA